MMPHQQSPARLEQQINQVLSDGPEAEVLLRISQVLGEAFGVDCCLVIVAGENQTVEQIGCWHSDAALTRMTRQQQMLVSQELLVSVMQETSVVIDDVSTQWQLLPIGSVLGIPTWFQGKLNGVISLIRSQPNSWSQVEKECALAVSASVAIAIAQVVQAELIAALQQQVRTSAEYQTIIKQSIMASRGSFELEKVLQSATAATAQTLQVERGLILMLKYVDPLFKIRERRETIPRAKVTAVYEWQSDRYSSALKSPSDDSTSFWLSECCLCQQALVNSPKPVVISQRQDLAAVNPATDVAPLLHLAFLPALVLFPLESQGRVLGFLVLQDSCDRSWKLEELALIEIVSAQVSTAIIQSQTLRQVQSLVDERTAQLQRSLEVQAKLYEKTRQQIDQLRQLNQMKDEFLSTVNHELRTPLTSMSLSIRMLRQPGIAAERQAKYLNILDQQCTQEINLINDLLTLQQLESHQAPLNLETLDLKAKIHDLAYSFEEKWADKELTINVDLPKAPLILQTDSESFDRILQELLTNAGKYSDPDTTVVLKATHQVNQQVKQIVLNLTNVGPGISPEDATHVFDKFRRGQGVTQQAIHGTGLGLALVKCLVQHLNGTISVASSPLNSSWETCFTLTLPLCFDPQTSP